MAFANTYKLTSGGAAYNLEIGFMPTRIEVINYTKWATDATKVKFIYNEGMLPGYALSELCEDTSTNRAIESSNGFTVLATRTYPTNIDTITGISKASKAVITAGSHPWTAANNGESIRITGVVGMTEINNLSGSFTYINANSFSVDIDSSNFTTYSSGGTAMNISEDQTPAKANATYRVTLGSTIIGADGDVLYVTAYQDDMYTDLGDIGA